MLPTDIFPLPRRVKYRSLDEKVDECMQIINNNKYTGLIYKSRNRPKGLEFYTGSLFNEFVKLGGFKFHEELNDDSCEYLKKALDGENNLGRLLYRKGGSHVIVKIMEPTGDPSDIKTVTIYVMSYKLPNEQYYFPIQLEGVILKDRLGEGWKIAYEDDPNHHRKVLWYDNNLKQWIPYEAYGVGRMEFVSGDSSKKIYGRFSISIGEKGRSEDAIRLEERLRDIFDNDRKDEVILVERNVLYALKNRDYRILNQLGIRDGKILVVPIAVYEQQDPSDPNTFYRAYSFAVIDLKSIDKLEGKVYYAFKEEEKSLKDFLEEDIPTVSTHTLALFKQVVRKLSDRGMYTTYLEDN